MGELDIGAGTAPAGGYAKRYTDFARGARATAVRHKTEGDSFGESLALTRAEVYEQAAELVNRTAPEQAAEQMMENARRLHVRTPPLTGFDEAGRRYISARAWQYCAREIDATLEEKAPSWD